MRLRLPSAVTPVVAGLLCGFGLVWPFATSTVAALGMVPGLALLSPDDGANASGRVVMAARADGEGLVSLQFQLDGRNFGPRITEGPCEAVFDTTGAADGPHTIQAMADDEFGNIVVSQPAVIFVNNLFPAPAGGCLTPDPFVVFGGGKCVHGGWLFPNMPGPNPSPVVASVNTPADPGSCLTPDPFVAFGGGVCVNGGWRFPDGSAPAPATTPAPLAGGCLTPDPFVAIGGGRCVNGGWLPPGIK